MPEDSQRKLNDATTPAASSTPAERALAEADARRRQADAASASPKEIGRQGPNPTRYGDWEKSGIASDF